MSLPVPHFELPWKAAGASRLTFTYPTGGADYNVDLDPGDAFPDLFALLVEVASQLSVLGVTAIWPTVTAAGRVSFVSQSSNFDLDLSTGGAEVQEWLGFTTGTFANVAAATGDGPYLRAFYPGAPLNRPPTLSRSRNLLQARTRGPTGHTFLNTLPMPEAPEGFVSAAFGVDFAVAAADYTAADMVDTPWHRLVSFLTGDRRAFEAPFSGGWYSKADLAAGATWEDPDALRERGASEHRFAYFDAFVDAGDHGTFSAYATAVEATRGYWFLHPDTSRIVLERRFQNLPTLWTCEFFAFGEVS